MKRHLLCALSICLPAACTVDATGVPETSEGMKRITDDAAGVSIAVPEDWAAKKDEVLFDTHGVILYSPDEAVARVALAYQAEPDGIEALVSAKLEEYADASPTRREITLSDGREAVAVTGLPGVRPYTVIYTRDGDRVYEIGLWHDEPELEERHLELTEHIRFQPPSTAIEALSLERPAEALYGQPPVTIAARNQAAQAERRAAFEEAAEHEPMLREAATTQILDPPPELTGDGTAAATCGFTAPRGLYWQLQWDRTNTFYSGSWYNLRNRPGWSAMSGNYGSWWGTNFHVWKCHGSRLNQWYANDWPAQYWANAYAAFSGYVEWAGWGTDGFASLGRYVVVRNGKYRSLTAHLTRIARGITWGKWINGYWKVIGYAGDTGERYANADWAPHLHARVGYGERLTRNGQPYGGHSVRPRKLRCFACNNYDVAAPGEGGYYTRFWHGRWMRF